MRRQVDRVGNLERGASSDLPPAIKAWLGQSLTASEQRQFDDDVGVEQDWDSIDTGDWSAEMKAWLGVN